MPASYPFARLCPFIFYPKIHNGWVQLVHELGRFTGYVLMSHHTYTLSNHNRLEISLEPATTDNKISQQTYGCRNAGTIPACEAVTDH
jgi:hypothetical protein